LLKIKNLK